MATVFQTTLVPTKLELVAGWIPSQPWFTGDASALEPVGGFRLDDPAGEVGLEFHLLRDGSTGRTYQVPLAYRGAASAEAEQGLIGTLEHGVLGTRWVYDGAYDPVLVAQLSALVVGDAEPQHQSTSDTPEPSVHRRWSGSGRPEPVAGQVLSDDTTTTVPLTGATADDGSPLVLAVVRVLEPGSDELPAPGVVSAEWTAPDGSPVRGPVAVVG